MKAILWSECRTLTNRCQWLNVSCGLVELLRNISWLKIMMSFLTCPATAALSSHMLNVKYVSLVVVFLEILVFCCFHYSFWGTWKSLEYCPKNRRITEKNEGRNGWTNKSYWKKKWGGTHQSSTGIKSGETGGRWCKESKNNSRLKWATVILKLKSYAFPTVFVYEEELFCILTIDHFMMFKI